ncbi:hypothetical protein AWI33_08150 [Klebsiella aerogenes]|nr:hypothetical protein AWI33_08150 [Klebsiella aerogenes]
MNNDLEKKVMRKVTLRIIPFIMLLYFIAFLDRVNIGFAALTMNEDLGFSPTVFGLGAGIFFLGYFLFEVPSNLILHKVGARIWIARVMITWGLVSGCREPVAEIKNDSRKETRFRYTEQKTQNIEAGCTLYKSHAARD